MHPALIEMLLRNAAQKDPKGWKRRANQMVNDWSIPDWQKGVFREVSQKIIKEENHNILKPG